MMLRRLILALWFAALPAAAAAQDGEEMATLVADSVRIDLDTRLVAEGNVEVFFGNRRLTATEIVYDRAGETIEITGPIRLTEGDGFVLVADSAELDRDLQDGILRSARMVLDQQLQIASAEIQRVGGRYTQMARAVASSCQVCSETAVPLWEIRARRVTHDTTASRIYFDGAQFRLAGLPLAYIPRLKIPDGSVDRAAGFLTPELKITSQFGTGLKLPYFQPIGESRDVTLTPYIADGTKTLEWRYRQAFRKGRLTFEGALSTDDLSDDWRGYIDADGSFSLPYGFGLKLSGTLTSDDAYLLDYGISSSDRIANNAEITRIRRDEAISAELLFYESLREGAAAERVPRVIGISSWERRFGGLGTGRGGLRLEATGIAKRGPANAEGDGRDTLRVTGRFDWRQDAVLRNGMQIAGLADLAVDAYSIADDPSFDTDLVRALPALGAELRWPFARVAPGGAVEVLEPVAQIVWAPDSLTEAPNEDSTVLEFDEGNLFAISRFPGSDRRELGARANLGLTWTRHAPEGWSASLAAGKVFRAEDLGQFTNASGLSGTSSDWLVAARLETGGLELTNRALFDDEFGLARDELRLGWRQRHFDLAASYIWIGEDPSENRDEDSAELYLDGGVRLGRNWNGDIEARYDVTAGRLSNTGLGVTYRNECISVDLSLSRRYTSSASVDPSTEFAFEVALNGFGSGYQGRRYRNSCGP